MELLRARCVLAGGFSTARPQIISLSNHSINWTLAGLVDGTIPPLTARILPRCHRRAGHARTAGERVALLTTALMCIINTNATAGAVPALVYKYGLRFLGVATLETNQSTATCSSRQLPSELPLTVSFNLRLTG